MSLADFFSRLRRPEPPPPDPVRTAAGQVQATRGLPRFLAGLGAKAEPTLLDLGSVVGSNVTFFGEQLGCKIFVEDLAKDIDRHAREDRAPDLAEFLDSRFPQEPESFDGIICWDIFDYLDRTAAHALARQVVRLLRTDGLVLAFFNHTERVAEFGPTYTRHVVVDERTIEHRSYAAARAKQRPFPNRDIQRMFEPLRITDQFLLKTNMRELVFRKGSVRDDRV